MLTLGFWKNHPRLWPLDVLSLGTVSYAQSQLLEILEEPPRGDGLVILAHQLIAAKLNIANGAEHTTIATTIADADALIDSLVIPPIGSGSLAPRLSSGLAARLDAYNNGLLGTQHCGGVAVDEASWGAVKRLYGDPAP